MINKIYNFSVLTDYWKKDKLLDELWYIKFFAFLYIKKIIYILAIHINIIIFIFICIIKIISLLLFGLELDLGGLLLNLNGDSNEFPDSSDGQSNGESDGRSDGQSNGGSNGRPEMEPNDQPNLIPNGESNQDSNDHNSDNGGGSEGEGSCTCCDQDQDTEGPCGCNYDCSPDMMNHNVEGSNGVCCGCRSTTYNYSCNDCTCTYCNNCYSDRVN